MNEKMQIFYIFLRLFLIKNLKIPKFIQKYIRIVFEIRL